MRKSIITLLLLSFVMIFVLSACGGGTGGGNMADNPSGQGGDTEETQEPPEEVEATIPEPNADGDYTGTDPDLLIATWEYLGEDPAWIEETLATFIDDFPIQQWVIGEFSIDDEEVEYEFDCDLGLWFFYGLGGKDLEYLDMYIEEDEEGVSLDSDAAFEIYTECEINLDEETGIVVRLDPWSFQEGAESAYYLWFYY